MANFVVVATGALSQLKLPVIPGLASFQGESFHTSRWNYDYTGGDSRSPMPGLADKNVAVVGTGATAIQCVPPLSRSAKHVYVIQRTPSTVAVRANKPIDKTWVAGLEPGWQADRRINFTSILAGDRVDVDLVDDGWTDVFRDLTQSAETLPDDPIEAARVRELADFAKMEAVRARIDAVVEDPEVAAKLKPYYAYLCKRPGFHDEYLNAFNRDNVTLVDTEGRGIEQIFEGGVEVAGRKYELDCIVYATGFEFDTAFPPYTRRIGFEIVGQGEVTLTEKWAKGITTLHGLTVHQFPNLFILPAPNTQSALTANVTHMLTENADHIRYIVDQTLMRPESTFEVTEDGERDWVQTILREREDNRAFLESCTPGRSNAEGSAGQRPLQNANFGPGALKFFEILRSWRADGATAGLTFS